MEKLEINIHKIKDKILLTKLKIQKIKHLISIEDNDLVYDSHIEKLKEAEKELNNFNLQLKAEEEKDKKEKEVYKKSLKVIKDSITEFSRISRTNSKLKKHMEEINKVILVIDKYLS